jgi:hypothetical protein
MIALGRQGVGNDPTSFPFGQRGVGDGDRAIRAWCESDRRSPTSIRAMRSVRAVKWMRA